MAISDLESLYFLNEREFPNGIPRDEITEMNLKWVILSRLAGKESSRQLYVVPVCSPKSGVVKNGGVALRVKRRDSYKVFCHFERNPDSAFLSGWSREISELQTEVGFRRFLDYGSEKHETSARNDREQVVRSAAFSV